MRRGSSELSWPKTGRIVYLEPDSFSDGDPLDILKEVRFGQWAIFEETMLREKDDHFRQIRRRKYAKNRFSQITRER